MFIQKELAIFYKKLGLINSSLEIYLSLENWDEVIKCYQTLDKRDKVRFFLMKTNFVVFQFHFKI